MRLASASNASIVSTTPQWGHGHAMTVDSVVDLADLAVLAERLVQMDHELVAKEVEVDPVIAVAAFGAAERSFIEGARFFEVAYLDGDVEWSQRGSAGRIIPRRRLGFSMPA